MSRRSSLRSAFLLGLAVVLSLLGVGGIRFEAEAQTSSQPKIQSVIVSGRTSQTATISFQLSMPPGETKAEVQVEYGTTASYGSFEPETFTERTLDNGGSFIVLSGLNPSTNYHFRLRVRPVGADQPSDTSADKSFTTRSTDSTGSPVPTVQSIVCTNTGGNTSCTVSFSTATKANVKLAWDTSFKSPTIAELCNPPSGYADCVGEPAGQFLSTVRQLRISGLRTSTEYHYRLVATDESGGEFMTGNAGTDSTFTTAESGRDRTFSTGGCDFGGRRYPIGSCLPDGSFCSASGIDTSCTNSCGYACAAGWSCRNSGLCTEDPKLTDSPYQCNKSDCYDNGVFKNPSDAGCYATWPKCSANSILKVTKDRGCNLWLTCGTSVSVPPAKNQPAETLCLNLAACNQLGDNGQCTHYLPRGQCDNDPLRFCANDKDCLAGGTCALPDRDNPTASLRDLTFSSPGEVKTLANLSGNVIPGVDWSSTGAGRVLPGWLPWQLMRQIGGSVPLRNADFETSAPDPTPWKPVPLCNKTVDTANSPPQASSAFCNASKDALQVVFEDVDNSTNHVLKVSPIKQIEQYSCVDETNTANPKIGNICEPSETADPCLHDPDDAGPQPATGSCQRRFETINFFGAATDEFFTQPTEIYYASARIRAEAGNPIIRFEFGYKNFTVFTVNDPTTGGGTVTKNAYTDVQATSAWQTVTIGPLRGLSGGTRVAAVCADFDSCGEFFIDDVVVKPILQVNTNPDYLTPSCRLYPKEDAPACDYIDQNGVAYKGWKGYCLEHDSASGSCLSWWPVDIIRGESNIFGSDKVVGYQDRTPMYYCAEAVGRQTQSDFAPPEPYVIKVAHPVAARGSGCDNFNDSITSYTIASCSGSMDAPAKAAPTPDTPEATLTESSISRAQFVPLSARAPIITFDNSPDFQISSPSSPWKEVLEDNTNVGIIYRYYDAATNENRWWHTMKVCESGASGDCVEAGLAFDATTGKFKYYYLNENDQEGQTEGAFYAVKLWVTEACTKIVQVVNPIGDNQAFAQRVNSRVYSVPELGYKRSTDVIPFAGIAGADPIDNPVRWDLLSVATKTQEFEDGQVRSGPAYACKGNCSTAICHVADPSSSSSFGREGNILRPTNACSAEDSDTNGKTDGYLSGGVQGASNRGVQIFASNYEPLPSEENLYFAQEKLKRLFAQSYGIWAWDGSIYQYVAGSNPNDFADGASDPNFKGWSSPHTICPVQEIQPTTSCNKIENLRCTATKDITSRPSATEEAAKDDALRTCRGATACDGRNAECNARGVQGTAVRFTAFEPASCVINTDGKYTCTGSCTTDATYTNAVPVLSNTSVFVSNRPTTPPGDYCAIPPSFSNVGFTTGTASVGIINGGGGSIGIKFNTAADAEQVPLRMIQIDWGDGDPDAIPYPYAPRTDPKKPHIYSHPYTYNKADSEHCPVLDGPCTYPIKIQVQDNWGWCSEAAQRWCSQNATSDGRATRQTAVACTSNAECRNSGVYTTCAYSGETVNGSVVNQKCQSSTDSRFWIDTGLKVILNP